MAVTITGWDWTPWTGDDAVPCDFCKASTGAECDKCSAFTCKDHTVVVGPDES